MPSTVWLGVLTTRKIYNLTGLLKRPPGTVRLNCFHRVRFTVIRTHKMALMIDSLCKLSCGGTKSTNLCPLMLRPGEKKKQNCQIIEFKIRDTRGQWGGVWKQMPKRILFPAKIKETKISPGQKINKFEKKAKLKLNNSKRQKWEKREKTKTEFITVTLWLMWTVFRSKKELLKWNWSL